MPRARPKSGRVVPPCRAGVQWRWASPVPAPRRTVERTPPFEQRLLGQTLAGKYKLVEVRAGGAFGAVFRAEQYFCGQFVRPVAVKVSRQTGLSQETAPHLFGDAIMLARILASGDHDGRRHLVQIFDMGLLPEHEDRAYIAMEYVEGAPLLAHMRRGRPRQRGHRPALRQADLSSHGAGPRPGGGPPRPQIRQHPRGPPRRGARRGLRPGLLRRPPARLRPRCAGHIHVHGAGNRPRAAPRRPRTYTVWV